MGSAPVIPQRVDHIAYAVPELSRGMDEIEDLLGVRPIAGGSHPGFGTHNALLSLGPGTYLEVIAPDPALARPLRGVPFGMDDHRESHLATWALRAETIEKIAATARSAGLDLGDVLSGRREKPDGTVLSWRLTDPYVMAFGGCVPFLISWGTTAHPASVAPRGGELIALRSEHPHPVAVRAALATLDVEMEVRESHSVRLIATIRTARGDVILR